MAENRFICERETVSPGEFVICDSEQAVAAHRELFNLDSNHYVVCRDDPFECLSSIHEKYHKVHIAASWKGMLGIALRRSHVAIDDVIYILTCAGMSHSDLAPFRQGKPDDIFPVLYYGKNFDMLRKVCNAAKKTVESHLKNIYTRIDCHLVCYETNKIIASSL